MVEYQKDCSILCQAARCLKNQCCCFRATVCFPGRNQRFNEHRCFPMHDQTANEPTNNKRNKTNISYSEAKPPSHRGDLKLSIRFASSEAACHKQNNDFINQDRASQAKHRFVQTLQTTFFFYQNSKGLSIIKHLFSQHNMCLNVRKRFACTRTSVIVINNNVFLHKTSFLFDPTFVLGAITSNPITVLRQRPGHLTRYVLKMDDGEEKCVVGSIDWCMSGTEGPETKDPWSSSCRHVSSSRQCID